MIRTFLSAAALISLVSACSPASENAKAPADTATAATDAESILPADATGFITANPLPLADDGSLRRDDYGRPYEYALLGEQLPHITGTMLDGSTFDSSELTNWTVIDVWGLWCSDCLADGPYVAALSRAINQDPDLDFLSIHVPASAARTTPEEMYKKYGSVDAYFAEKRPPGKELAAGWRLFLSGRDRHGHQPAQRAEDRLDPLLPARLTRWGCEGLSQRILRGGGRAGQGLPERHRPREGGAVDTASRRGSIWPGKAQPGVVPGPFRYHLPAQPSQAEFPGPILDAAFEQSACTG